MGSCVARQPIFNKSLKIFGYELLFRIDSESSSFQGEVSPDTATSETISNSFHEIGIERVTNGKHAFINFTEKLLLDQVATILPNKILVIEILENVQPTPEVLAACKALRDKGYLLALDDFILKPEFIPFLSIASIVKIDFLNTPLEDIKRYLAQMKRYPIVFLAEKLETYGDFELAKSLGFTLFQGYFFSKPMIVNVDIKLTPMNLNRMQLIRLSFDPNVNYTKIANIIKQDIALSYRLFRVVNSAYFGLKYTVKNIRQALSILGMDEIKKWVTLISMSQMKDDKPSELITMSLVRARFLELLAPFAGLSKSGEDLFMVGLMSLMDAIMDLPMEEIVVRTHISTNIAEPLISKDGKIYDLLQIISYYEASRWDEVLALSEKYKISINKIAELYLQAIDWANKL